MINCDKCNKQITDPYDVNIVALLAIKPIKMCNACYASRERGFTRHLFYFPKWFPINSKPYLALLVVSSIIMCIVAIAILVGTGTWTADGETFEPSIWTKVFVILVFSMFIFWLWILWIRTQKIIKKL